MILAILLFMLAADSPCGAYPSGIVGTITCPAGTTLEISCRVEDRNWIVSCVPTKQT